MSKEAGFPATIIAIVVLLSAGMTPLMAGTVPGSEAEMPADIAALYHSGSYTNAAEALHTALEGSPNDASLYFWLGRCYFEIRDFDQSISSWEHAIALDSIRSEYHDWLGRAYGRKAEQDAHFKMASALSLARRTHHEFEVAVQLDAKNIDAQRDLIAFMANAPSNLGGGESRALNQIHSLSAVDPLEGTLALADLYATEKKFDQAGVEYQKVLKSAPHSIVAYFEIADYYRDRADSEHLEQAVEAAKKVAPSDRRLNYYRGVMLALENRDPEIAENDLRTYIETVPDNSELPSHSSAYEYLGKLYENRSQPELALQAYQASLSLDSENKTSRDALKRLKKK